jgi:galactose mutarotase-like enzyme
MPENSLNTYLKSGTGNKLEVSQIGAKITLILNHTPILIPVTRGDNKCISTHICTPNFGKELNTAYGLNQHGNMRNSPCIVNKQNNQITVKYEIKDAPGKYPSGLIVDAKLLFKSQTFFLIIKHTNSGKTEAPVNVGIHCYFNAPKSYQNTTVNGKDISKLAETTGSIKLQKSNIIQIPNQPTVILAQQGFPKAVIWVYKNELGQFDDKYICIEPIEYLPTEFGKPETYIKPGESRKIQFSLTLQ